MRPTLPECEVRCPNAPDTARKSPNLHHAASGSFELSQRSTRPKSCRAFGPLRLFQRTPPQSAVL
eukprot:13388727-Alexandrium_andersonii.AAC.1